jgi:hypothetical protein
MENYLPIGEVGDHANVQIPEVGEDIGISPGSRSRSPVGEGRLLAACAVRTEARCVSGIERHDCSHVRVRQSNISRGGVERVQGFQKGGQGSILLRLFRLDSIIISHAIRPAFRAQSFISLPLATTRNSCNNSRTDTKIHRTLSRRMSPVARTTESKVESTDLPLISPTCQVILPLPAASEIAIKRAASRLGTPRSSPSEAPSSVP